MGHTLWFLTAAKSIQPYMASRKTILLRVDGGPGTGLGHVMRCLALAEELNARGHACRFAGTAPDYVTRMLPGGAPVAVAQGMAAWSDPAFRALVDKASVLVTDHYGLGADWQGRSPIPVAAITDPPLARQHCDLLILPTAFEGPAGALLAPAHSLIRRAFRDARKGPKTGRRLLVNCGGGADGGLTAKVLDAIASDPALAALDITAVGPDIRPHPGLPRLDIRAEVVDMAGLAAAHDVAVGAPAGAALERACLGLAQLLVPIADNQLALGAALSERGAARVLAPGATAGAIAGELVRLMKDDEARKAMAMRAHALHDGLGATRVAEAVERLARS